MRSRLDWEIKRLVETAGVTTFICGGALGFDTIAALAVLEARKRRPTLRLVLALPYKEQDRSFCDKDKAVYRKILSLADDIVYVSENYTRGCMHKRNRYMVEHSAICLCYLTGECGGTAYTVNYAKKQGLEIFNIAE